MKSSRNDITGDKIQSKISNKLYEENYDKIFGSKQKKEVSTVKDCTSCKRVGCDYSFMRQCKDFCFWSDKKE